MNNHYLLLSTATNNYFRYCTRMLLFSSFCLFNVTAAHSQQVAGTGGDHKVVVAGKQYGARKTHRFFLGEHYRKEWTTPVSVPVVNLDSVAGGLTPVKQGGGRQTKTLRLVNKEGKQYVLRSIDKDFSAALPEIARGTFVEKLAKDQVSIAHPFAPIVVPPLAEAAGIYHTNPQIVYVPDSKALGEYSSVFANTLCLLEERPDDNQEDAPNFGNSAKVVSTDKMYEKVFEDNDNRVDQNAFLRARLFDMFLGDWGRHDDQWRWGKFEEGDKTIYKPIPRDRDQAFTKFDGFLPHLVVSQESLEHLQTFDYEIRNVKKYNFPARYLDRQLLNEVPEEKWVSTAKELQQSLTDGVIEQALHQLPPELFKISGEEITAKLKSRRDHLVKYAQKYYKFLSEEVEVVGTKRNELFEVNRLNNDETKVDVYKINKEGAVETEPFYSRTFHRKGTDEIRLYGLDGNDVYHINGQAKKGIKVRIIGGIGKDSLVDNSHVGGAGHKTKVYDNPGSNFVTSSETKLHLSEDTAINRYNYRGFIANTGHVIKLPSYNSPLGAYISLGYTYRKYLWRTEPFGWEQSLRLYYSFSRNSFGVMYEGLFNEVIGKWNVAVNAAYDALRQENFFGIGNETVRTNKSVTHYRLRSREFYGSIGINRQLNPYNFLSLSLVYHPVEIINEDNHFVNEVFNTVDPSVFDWKQFGGGRIAYTFKKVNDPVVPTGGFQFVSSINHSINLKQNDRSYTNYAGAATVFIPFSKKISLASRVGGATITGDPEFYQLNRIGGGQYLRGVRRGRYYGKSSFYNNNDLRWITNTRNYFFNGKIGLLALLDDGRVWQPKEKSDKWHVGYGGGIIIVPFNKILISVTYATSKEDKLLNLQLGASF